MKSLERIDPIFERLFSKISPKIADSFTDEQVKAIQKGFGSQVVTRHSLDIRLSIPIPGLRFYLVLLAGSERRSQQRLQNEKGKYPIFNGGNIIFLTGFLTVLLSCSFTIFPFLWSSLTSLVSISTSPSTSPFPTSIPWIFDKSECEHTNRTWRNEKCWDDQHSPMF
ncbi:MULTISPECIES: hypothetical protein [unclassified Nostoc]|uniref:hypothetical protein n=1 Tax=unclassified Nostoc TaxID=2593658 RepID=UPI00262D8CB7|nr:hypothetical protein [Nostoc sp. S13]MDF5736939.1 hypothetical protein [Nostoc sp. S13]